jgi:hypothetical protein
MSGSHKSWYKIFTRNNSGLDKRAQCFEYSKRDTIENQPRGQAEAYATSVGEGSLGAGALDEGAEAEGIGTGRIDGWRVVDDDDYNQSVGNPKRKV